MADTRDTEQQDIGADDQDSSNAEERNESESPEEQGDQERESGENDASNQIPDRTAGSPVGKESPEHARKRKQEYSNSLVESVKYWQGDDKIPTDIEEVKGTLKDVSGLGESFDLVFREMTFAGRKFGYFFVSGFAKDNIMQIVLARLSMLDEKQISADALRAFFDLYIPHIQVELMTSMSQTINKVFQGYSVFYIEQESTSIVLDTRNYPARGPDEPSLEKVVRGARDGFTETLLTNVALVRRRVRDPGLKVEIMQVGRRTQTDVSILYIDDIADIRLVESIRKKIQSVDIYGLPLADKQLEEAIIQKGWNPYPLVRYSERPDVVADHLLDGSVVILVDTSPSVMIMPTTFFDLCQHAEENRQTPFMGTYLRWIRFLGIFASLFLLPIWLLLVMDPGLKPAYLQILGPQETGKLPLLLQFILAEFGVDLMRMASIHTPTPLATAMTLVAAILLGEIAVKTGVFVYEVILYMAFAAVGMFATPSYELALANRMVRLILLVAVALFKVHGLIIGITVYIIVLTLHRSYNSSYLWPFIPFNAKAMFNIFVRQPVLNNKDRPSLNKPKDRTKMRNNQK